MSAAPGQLGDGTSDHRRHRKLHVHTEDDRCLRSGHSHRAERADLLVRTPATPASFERLSRLPFVPNESPSQRRARLMHENKAAATRRRRCCDTGSIRGGYAGMRGPDEGYVIAALLEACAFDLSDLPAQARRAVTAAVGSCSMTPRRSPERWVRPSRGDGF
ncbi:hypothetical protein PSA01_40560 [Pseudonocardia saturnea]|uniref:Uncharacterized protein n=1 Tax=Pseudonocardia saturnea TaxID=33909 RepID=A0ABQ0S298_9PSEU|nr:hypothetical protein PSA01_40560 [Pseudonocardia saturnea]